VASPCRRQIEQACAARLDGLAYAGNLVRGEIVHDDNAVLGERRCEQLFTPGHERLSNQGTVAQHGRDKAVGRQSIDEGDGLPVSVRDRCSATLSRLRPSSQARHLGGQITFVDEDQASGGGASSGRHPASRSILQRLNQHSTRPGIPPTRVSGSLV